jgi:hypothetical protein
LFHIVLDLLFSDGECHIVEGAAPFYLAFFTQLVDGLIWLVESSVNDFGCEDVRRHDVVSFTLCLNLSDDG